jgi:peptide/nickel transport system substrate-binding protein
MRLPTRWALLIVAYTATGACRGADSVGGRPLVIVRPEDALTLDPAAITDTDSAQVASQIFETLVRYRPGSTDVEPALATKWRVSKDGTRWSFDLRSGVTFHDGSLFDADAVVFSLERQRDPAHRAHFQLFPYWENTFRNIVSTRKLSPRQIEIRIRRPFAPFLANLAMLPVAIVSPQAMIAAGKKSSTLPVGTGPYRLQSWTPGRRIVLVRHKQYWGGAPEVDQLVFKVVPDPRQRLLALQSGTAGIARALAPEDRQVVKLHPDLRLMRLPGRNVAYLAMNLRQPYFQDIRVRWALNHAINKGALVKLVYQGLGVPAHGPLPPTIWSFNRAIKTYDYDPERSRRLLKEAAFDRSRRLRLFTTSSPRPYLPSPVLAARMIASNLVSVGLSVEIVIQPHGEHLDSLRHGKHDLCLSGWIGDNGDPDNFLHVLLDRDNARVGTAQNVAFFANDEVHHLLVRARADHDRRQREIYYKRAQAIIAEQAPWVPLAHTDIVVAARHSVTRLVLQPDHTIIYRLLRLRDDGP